VQGWQNSRFTRLCREPKDRVIRDDLLCFPDFDNAFDGPCNDGPIRYGEIIPQIILIHDAIARKQAYRR
jgi:hypothetical protein